jgi:hypothetical protein
VAFTTVTVTRDYDLADGTDPTGTVTFTPTAPMINGVTVVAAAVTERLNVDGRLTIELAANTDPDTLPSPDGYYLVKEVIAGATRSYYVQIPHDQGSDIDLSTLDTVTAVPAPDAVTMVTLLAAKQPLATLLTRLATAPVTVTYAASITVDAALGCVFRVTATGDLTLADITGGIDGQSVALEVLASGGDRVVTITGGGVVTVASGQRWTASFRYNSTANVWLLT